MVPLSLYIHFPWCIQKCPYCDFNSHERGHAGLYQQYITELIKDARLITSIIGARMIRTIFIGGGTPSLIPPDELSRLFTELRSILNIAPACEITLEANPGTVDQASFKEYFQLGINRLSMGIQSLNDRHLQKLGRIHSAREALIALDVARAAGFNNINCDLMFGLPEQTQAEAIADLEGIIRLSPQHISHYQLTLEPNTRFYHNPPSLPASELLETMQLSAHTLLMEAGFDQYEVSAFARSAHECRHNINYWSFGDYIGIGAGAHGKITALPEAEITRTVIERHPRHYLHKSPQDRLQCFSVPVQERPFEFMLNALRLKQGVPLTLFEERTLMPLTAIEPVLAQLIRKNLLEIVHDELRATARGFLFLNQILESFIE